MNEGIPKQFNAKEFTPEVANANEAPQAERELTPETLEVAVERAGQLIDELQAFDQRSEDGVLVALTRDEWTKAGELSAQLKEELKYIPADRCLQEGLPYHPTDYKYEYPRKPFPEKPEYPLPYNPKPSADGSRVDQEYQVAA